MANTILALDLGTTTGWRQIPDWPAYEVSPDGCVRRIRQSKGARAYRILRPLLNKKTGYLAVCLNDAPRSNRIDIHRLVALAFLGPPPSSRHLVAHNDGIRTNNTVGNLRWATQAENLRDCHLHGTSQVGSKNAATCLKETDILAIRRMKADGVPRPVIAARYGLHKRTVFRILAGSSWGHVQ